MITGKIKQIETMGLVDGPGVRVVIFMQGCYLRCLFCHNPEMWNYNGEITYTPDQIIDLILKYKNYFGEDGGVTFSGGEPLFQPEFLLECLKLCKNSDINTCLETAGVGNDKYYEEILKYTDLVIFDIKALNNDEFKKITGHSIDESQKFLSLCQQLNKKLWLTSVIVPGINDNDNYINNLANFISQLKNVEKVELLPYQTLGESKYEDLGMIYRLKDVPAMDAVRCKELENLLKEKLS